MEWLYSLLKITLINLFRNISYTYPIVTPEGSQFTARHHVTIHKFLKFISITTSP